MATTTARMLLTALVLGAGSGWTGGATAAPAPDSELIGCERAAERVQVDRTSHLDPSCVWTAGLDVIASGVTLDCDGAVIRGELSTPGAGIAVVAPEGQVLADVTVRNCTVEGFTNSIRVTRTGFRSLPRGSEWDHTTERIVLEDNRVGSSRGVGIFVDGYVSDVTVRNNEVRGAGSSGIYLETGSRRNHVIDNEIVDNGYLQNGLGGDFLDLAGTRFWYWGVGREGISVDGSAENLIEGNHLEGNSAGGIFLYKNCGEYPDRAAWFERRYGATDNTIRNNTFAGGRNGVWIGSRMGENTLPMACTDEAYVETPGRRIVLDHAERTTVEGNRFENVTYGVRVEDDDAVVTDNTFAGPGPTHHAVVVGTPDRTEVLGRPVRGLHLTGNRSTIVGNADPYRWVHGNVGTTESDNLALGRTRTLCEGEPIPRQLMVMVIAIAAALPDGSMPPPPDLTVDELGALAPCTEDPEPSTPTTAPPTPTDPTPRPATAVAGRPTYTG